jgi:hypothetical protein
MKSQVGPAAENVLRSKVVYIFLFLFVLYPVLGAGLAQAV